MQVGVVLGVLSVTSGLSVAVGGALNFIQEEESMVTPIVLHNGAQGRGTLASGYSRTHAQDIRPLLPSSRGNYLRPG
jgi:hypothetical protein